MVLIAAVISFCWEVRIYNSLDLGFIVHFYLSNYFSDIVWPMGFWSWQKWLIDRTPVTSVPGIHPIKICEQLHLAHHSFYFFPCFRLFDEQLHFSSFPGTNNCLDNRIFINFLRFDVLAITSCDFLRDLHMFSFVYIPVLVADRRLGGHKLKFYFSQVFKFAELKLQV